MCKKILSILSVKEKISVSDESSNFPSKIVVIRFPHEHTESSFQFRFHIICVARLFSSSWNVH